MTLAQFIRGIVNSKNKRNKEKREAERHQMKKTLSRCLTRTENTKRVDGKKIEMKQWRNENLETELKKVDLENKKNN